MEIGDFNGLWVATHTFQGDIPDVPNAYSHMETHLIIRDGLFAGVGRGGVIWTGRARIDGDDVVTEAVFDARNAPTDTFVLDVGGTPTRGPVQHTDRLKPLVSGDTVVLDGEVHRGPVTIAVSVSRVRTLDE